MGSVFMSVSAAAYERVGIRVGVLLFMPVCVCVCSWPALAVLRGADGEQQGEDSSPAGSRLLTLQGVLNNNTSCTSRHAGTQK